MKAPFMSSSGDSNGERPKARLFSGPRRPILALLSRWIDSLSSEGLCELASCCGQAARIAMLLSVTC